MNAFFARASKISYLIGGVLSLIHLIISWHVIVNIGIKEPDAQWQLIWIVFIPFDFPFSLLVLFSGVIFADFSVKCFPYPVSDFRDFILPAIVHGVIGPLWYFLFPICISSLRAKARGAKSHCYRK